MTVFSDVAGSGGSTPGRGSYAVFDVAEPVVLSDAWGDRRTALQIAQNRLADSPSLGTPDDQYTQGVRYWPGPRVWTLAPIQERMHRFQEAYPEGINADDFMFMVKQAEGNLIRTMALIGISLIEMDIRQSWLFGLPGSGEMPPADLKGSLQARANLMQWVHVKPTADYTQIASRAGLHPPQNVEAASGVLTLPQPNIRMMPVVRSLQNQRADQGFFLRWCVPGTPNNNPDYILNFWFGQYCLVIKGDGMAELHEYCRPKGGGDYRWPKQPRFAFRYASANDVLNSTHMLTIFPVRNRWGEKYICFNPNSIGQGHGLRDYGVMTGGTNHDGLFLRQEVAYQADPVTRGGDQDEAPGHVTRSGPIRIDHRRDLRVAWHVSQLLFTPVGKIRDMPFPPRPVYDATGGAQHFSVSVDARLPLSESSGLPQAGYHAQADVYDAETGFWFSGTNYSQIGLPQAVLTLTAPALNGPTAVENGASPDTPVLSGYSLWQDAVTRIQTPDSIQTNVSSFSANGPDVAMDLERGVLNVMDPGDEFPRLRARGELAVKVATTFLPPDDSPEQEVVLFRGYANSPYRTQHGRYDAEGLRNGVLAGEPEGGFGQGAARLWPDPEWSTYSMPLVGIGRRLMADRRNMRLTGLWRKYAQDLDAPQVVAYGGTDKVPPPWKVTAALRDVLKQDGWPDDAIQIPDRPMPLWPGVGREQSNEEIDFYTDYLSWMVRVCRGYLGAVLAFDTNWPSSIGGAWILIENAGEPGQTPIFHFQTYADYGTIPPHLPWAMNAINKGFVTGPLKGYTKPPDYNRVIVCTTPEMLLPDYKGPVYAADLSNPQSYFVRDSGIVPDPNNPHYLPGGERLLLIVDATLRGVTDADSQRAVDWTARRYFDFTCRAQRILPVEGPLYCIKDAAYGLWRQMRYGDPVTFDGSEDWFVRECAPHIELDTNQAASYELFKALPVEPVTTHYTGRE